MSKRFLFVALLLFSFSYCYSQKGKKSKIKLPQQQSHSNIGFGMGLDYGGFGLKVGLLSFQYVELFGGVGYNLLEIAGNAGLSIKILPGSKFCPYISGMYGYNAVDVTSVSGSGPIKYKSGETYYGISVNGGVRIVLSDKLFLNTGVTVPFRSDKALADGRTYSPVLVSLGFHFLVPNL
jgi:hypothetical protein